MKWKRKELKARAKELLNQNYWRAVLIALILSLCSGTLHLSALSGYTAQDYAAENLLESLGNHIPVILTVTGAVLSSAMLLGIFLRIFVLNPIRISCRRFYLDNHVAPASLKDLGFAFENHYLNIVKTMFFRELYISLWSLLLFIPGIVKSYEYRMIPYLLAEDPGMDSREIFKTSKTLMRRNKWRTFVLDLSFVGWKILSGLTMGILGVFYVGPYIELTGCELFCALKEAKGKTA